jgi:hypothetical protein
MCLPAMTTKVLGIDTALVGWEAVGSGVIEFDASSFTRLLSPAVAWPRQPLSARALAVEIDRFARAEQIAAVSIDGPQGWRNPVTPPTPPGTPGVGRRCEYLCRTQGKTGVYPQTYPACTLKLWEAQGPRTITLGNVTFPAGEQAGKQGPAREQ